MWLVNQTHILDFWCVLVNLDRLLKKKKKIVLRSPQNHSLVSLFYIKFRSCRLWLPCKNEKNREVKIFALNQIFLNHSKKSRLIFKNIVSRSSQKPSRVSLYKFRSFKLLCLNMNVYIIWFTDGHTKFRLLYGRMKIILPKCAITCQRSG